MLDVNVFNGNLVYLIRPLEILFLTVFIVYKLERQADPLLRLNGG